ncbi:tetratricopeptide repeat protein [Luteolibacter marinus]|uniref:tetratricopeptide repeat protein n=1 Tax=Luteolibacter marinus TaxID=2776705 RepID=UPI0018692B34|nr:hypothetical protein [Luteolibacter marinus]
MRIVALPWITLSLAAAASPQLDFARGVLARERGDREAEAAAFEAARAADPTAFFLTDRVAELRRGAGDLEGASTLYREFAAAHPRYLRAHLTYADFLRDSAPGDDFVAKLALETLENSLAEFPRSLAVKKRLFRTYESLGQREKSTALFESLAADPEGVDDAVAAAGMARTLFPKDDPAALARMDALYREACRKVPADPDLALEASMHFRGTGRLAEAAGILEAHVAAAPWSLDLRIKRAVMLLMLDRQDDGEKALLEVLEIDPRKDLAHQTLAKLYRKQERVAEALPHAAEVLTIRGGSASEFLDLADEFLAADRSREARLLLEKAVFFHPDDAGLLVKLAVATRRDPESRDQASRLFREAEAMSGEDGPAGDPEFLCEFAESLLEGGQTAAAEERLRRAIRAFPAGAEKKTAAALRRLAGIWQAEKRNEEAAKALLQRADSLDPR